MPSKTVAEFIAAAPKDKRAGLKHLRQTIKAAAPKSTEGISYGVPVFRHKGEPLIYIGYGKDHLSIYGSLGGYIKAHAAELKRYDMSKGTIRFPLEKPVPVRLVTKIVKARIAEVE